MPRAKPKRRPKLTHKHRHNLMSRIGLALQLRIDSTRTIKPAPRKGRGGCLRLWLKLGVVFRLGLKLVFRLGLMLRLRLKLQLMRLIAYS